MSLKLTPGAVPKLYNGSTDGFEPVVQVLECKEHNNRYRCVISDGAEVQQCVINRDGNPQLKEHYCIKITDAVLNRIQSRPQPLLTVLRFNVVAMTSQVIGKPNLASLGASQQQQAPQQRAPQQQQQASRQQASSSRGGGAQQASRSSSSTPNRGGRGSTQKSSYTNDEIDESQVMPISALNPYTSKWVIKARVTKKGELKSWSKGDKSGYIFAVELIDEGKGEIKASAFNSAAQKFFEIFNEGCVYLVANGRLKHANKQYNTLNNEYEITLEESTIVKEVQDDSGIPAVHFNFKTIDDIMQTEADQTVDLCAVVQDPGTCEPFTTKKHNQTFRRTLKLLDGTQDHVSTIELTLWGKSAETINVNEGSILACRGLRTSNFRSVSLNSIFSSQFYVDRLDIPEVADLSAWYNESYLMNDDLRSNVKAASTKTEGGARKYRPVSYLTDIKTYNLGIGAPKGDTMMVVGTVTYIRDTNMFYPACGNQDCYGKKLEKGEFDEKWFCQKCQNYYDEPTWRYVVSMRIADVSDEQWITAFGESAASIFGVEAGTLREESEAEDKTSFKNTVQNAMFRQFSMRVKVIEDNRRNPSEEEMGESSGSKVKLQLLAAYPLTFTTQSKRLLSLINSIA